MTTMNRELTESEKEERTLLQAMNYVWQTIYSDVLAGRRSVSSAEVIEMVLDGGRLEMTLREDRRYREAGLDKLVRAMPYPELKALAAKAFPAKRYGY